MAQVVQVAGAHRRPRRLRALQFGRLDQRSTSYLTLNFVGPVILTVLAARAAAGFFLLEGVWAIVSAYGFYARRRDAVPA